MTSASTLLVTIEPVAVGGIVPFASASLRSTLLISSKGKVGAQLAFVGHSRYGRAALLAWWRTPSPAPSS